MIDETRTRLSMTQDEFAALLGLSRRQVQYYESGNKKPTLLFKMALAWLRTRAGKRFATRWLGEYRTAPNRTSEEI